MPKTSPSRRTSNLARLLPARTERISAWARRFVDDGHLPFQILEIGNREGALFVDTHGKIDSNGTEASAESLVRIYSMTKPVTGVALLQLLEQGRFCLDDPIEEYLPELSGLGVLSGGGFAGVETEPAKTVTVRHLATHTSGMTYHFFGHDPVAALYREAGVTGGLPAPQHDSLASWTKALGKLPLLFQPGERWNYSVGMDVLGRLIEVLSGQRLADYFEEHILAPLGMHDTGFSVPIEKAGRLAALSRRGDSGDLESIDPGGEHSPLCEEPSIDFGGGGLVSTCNDYARFARMLLRSGELDGVRILSRKTVDLMASNHLPPHLSPLVGAAPITSLASMRWFRGAGFGITVATTVDPALDGTAGSVGAFGWGGAASTQFWVDRSEDLYAIQLTQFLPSGTYPLRPQFRNLVYQALA